MKLNKILDIFVELKIRMDTGIGYMNWVKNLIIMVAGIKFIFDISNIGIMILLVFVFMWVIFLVGWLALDILKLVQLETGKRDGKYNYFLKKIGNRILRKI